MISLLEQPLNIGDRVVHIYPGYNGLRYVVATVEGFTPQKVKISIVRREKKVSPFTLIHLPADSTIQYGNLRTGREK